MALPISEVATLTGVTTRTLRHYDAIGLLSPSHVGANGYRFYEDAELLRLQQILLMRELGLGLDAIAEVLAGQVDQLDASRGHEEWLRTERVRLGRLADTVARTIEHLQEGTPMSASEMFDGFDAQRAEAEEKLADKYGDGVRDHFATARERTKDWTAVDYAGAVADWDRLDDAMLVHLHAGTAPTDTFDVVEQHYASVAQHWTPDRTSYAGLGQWYVDDPQFKARYDAKDPRLAAYWRDALAAYAKERLS